MAGPFDSMRGGGGPDKFAQQRQLALQKQQFARQLANGEVSIVDRFGAKVTVGDMVLYQPDADYVMDVVDVRVPQDPRAPLGALQLVLQVQATITVPANTALPKVVRVGKRSADGQHVEIETPLVVVEEAGAAVEPSAAENPGGLDDSDGRD